VLALHHLGRKGEALSELSGAVPQYPVQARRLAEAAPPTATGVPADGDPDHSAEKALRLLIGHHPEVQQWMRDLLARTRPRPARAADRRSSGRYRVAPLAAAARAPAAHPQRRRSAHATPKAAPAVPDPGDSVLRLKVTLLGTRPPVWRRLEVSSRSSLATFHDVLQQAMGWTDSHLHLFQAGTVRWSDRSSDLGPAVRDERKSTLAQVLRHPGASLDYEYDFGDGWQHHIVLEEILPHSPGGPVAVCVGGRRRCPPEDCGGIGGFFDLLARLRDGDSPERRDLIEWLGGEVDFDSFDQQEVNRQLVHIR
jgi:Plasmid pRiA4b ORF-3-like protein